MIGVSVSLESVSKEPKPRGVKLSVDGDVGDVGPLQLLSPVPWRRKLPIPPTPLPWPPSSVQTIDIDGGGVLKDIDPLDELSAEKADLLLGGLW